MNAPTGNLFIDTLSDELRTACLALGGLCEFGPGDVVAHKGDVYGDIHFPVSGMISEVEEGRDGGSAEVTIVGFEGCSGIEALLGARSQPFLRCVELPTRALAIPASGLLTLHDRSSELQRFVRRYVAARLRGLGISIGCYARHPVTARLARWLLRVHDRVRANEFALTQDTIALMLGVRRSTVTRSFIELVDAGSIASSRNHVRITDRRVLETVSCSCYPDARDVFTDLYGEAPQNEIS